MLFECQGAVDLDGINLMVKDTIGRINHNLYEHFFDIVYCPVLPFSCKGFIDYFINPFN